MPASCRTGCSTRSAGSRRSGRCSWSPTCAGSGRSGDGGFLAGWLAGAGFFQLYDGLVQHKLMGLHQIRYEVDLLPYDVVGNVVAAALLVAGVVLIAATGRAARQPA